MERKVKICTLCADSAQGAAQLLQQRLHKSRIAAETEDFGDAVAFAARAADIAADGVTVIAAAPLDMFLNAKLRLLKAFSFKIVKSKSIISAMGANAPANLKELDLHAAIPQKAKAFVSQDGLFSAFAAKDGDGLVIFLPLDESRLQYLFDAGVEAIFTGAALNTAPKTKMQELKERVDNVAKSGKTVAISSCGSAKMLLSAISAIPSSASAFTADNASRERVDGESDADYIAQCAKASKENSETDLGIAISEIYNDGSDDFVIVCVADSERAKAAKVFANPGEDKKLLIVAAVIKLCQMLDELSVAGMVNPNPPAPKPQSKNYRTPLLVAIIGIAAAIVICIIIAFLLSGKQKDSALAYAEQSALAQQQETLMHTEEYEYNYQGGSGLDFEDFGAIAIEPETSTSAFMTSIYEATSEFTTAAKTTVAQTVTKVLTTIVKTTKATTAKATTTKAATTTTTKPTTTAKPTTTKATTTTKPATTTATTTSEATVSGGTFVFRVYGYGHGVGMSQHGAMQMAKNGDNYEKILTHYYPGTTVKTETSTPATINYGGVDIPIVEYLCKTTKKEMGYSSAGAEAVKAQMATIYTYAKHNNFVVKRSQHAYDDSFEFEGTQIYNTCLEYLGMATAEDTPVAKYVDYNGQAANTVYFASSAGRTASAVSVWKTDKYPYLAGGVSSPETVDKSTVEISADEMKKYIESYAQDNDITITLSDNPAEWLEIVSHDSAYSENTGYITEIRVGNYKMKGNAFRSYVMDFKIRSHCFTVEYIPE